MLTNRGSHLHLLPLSEYSTPLDVLLEFLKNVAPVIRHLWTNFASSTGRVHAARNPYMIVY